MSGEMTDFGKYSANDLLLGIFNKGFSINILYAVESARNIGIAFQGKLTNLFNNKKPEFSAFHPSFKCLHHSWQCMQDIFIIV